MIGFDFVYRIDADGWGWIHPILDAVAIVGGVGLFSATSWAAVAAIVVTDLSITLNFMWRPTTPGRSS